MKKTFKATAIAVALALLPASGNAGIPVAVVADLQGALEHLDRLRHYIELYGKIQEEIEQQKKIRESLSGVRNFGDIFDDPLLRTYFPPDYGLVYDAMKSEGYMGLLENGKLTYALNKFADNCENLLVHEDKMYCEAMAVGPSQDYATSKDIFERTMVHTMNITELQKQINNTQDIKAIAELQARINVEQAQIMNLSNQLVTANAMSASRNRMDTQIAVERNGAWFKSKDKLKLELVGEL